MGFTSWQLRNNIRSGRGNSRDRKESFLRLGEVRKNLSEAGSFQETRVEQRVNFRSPLVGDDTAILISLLFLPLLILLRRLTRREVVRQRPFPSCARVELQESALSAGSHHTEVYRDQYCVVRWPQTLPFQAFARLLEAYLTKVEEIVWC